MRRLAFLLVIPICFFQIDISHAVSDDTKTFVPIGQTDKGMKVGLNQFNGRLWNKMDLKQKSFYILGMLEGIDAFYISSDPVAEKYIKQFDKIKDSFHTIGFNNVEIAKMIDAFYEDNSNIKVPIFEILKCVVLKTKGSSQDDLDKVLSSLRKKYN
jgi:hypothetical protein